MKLIFVFFLLLPAFVSAASSASSEVLQWSELPDPEAQNFEDPFAKLTFEQLADLREITRLDQQLATTGFEKAERQSVELRRDELIARLGEKGIDAEAVIAQRWEIAEKRSASYTAVNPQVLSKDVTLQGFIFPGPLSEDGTPTAYLVPEVGMCSHYPPPPPNKLVRILLSETQEIGGFYIPVEVNGVLKAVVNRTEAYLIDGPRVLDSSVTLVAENLTIVSSKLRGRASQIQTNRTEFGFSSAVDAIRQRNN